MILIIDNYDSFTYNLMQCVGELKNHVKVLRNDNISLNYIEEKKPTHIIISPGPGRPENLGVSLDIIKYYAKSIPILGVCLGHQSIGYIYGGQIKKLKKPMHGKISHIHHNNQDIFKGLSNPFLATRYHSLIINREELPKELIITATTEKGTIMGCRHKKYPLIRGIQFHPESLWTENGKLIIKKLFIS